MVVCQLHTLKFLHVIQELQNNPHITQKILQSDQRHKKIFALSEGI